ncbi:P-loop containing nucleoside triphosphate hydrolase protein [Hygrophoropsis aurantiaca]|uniref:P-loop containing nucleoside triphosphate hydrolase protein n=1 Tax=Hygrophoropsis aurantiaca TaxID=72124 RepID=A0ACB8AIC4_9AGAM|nr:P-loop containing nucleoside triphosphate hydrolase protein [Hygrophoropsis aurantiaca]
MADSPSIVSKVEEDSVSVYAEPTGESDGTTTVEQESSESIPDKTEEPGHHFLRRWQRWDERKFIWLPYDPSKVPPPPPRDDNHNYFYVNVRYVNPRAKPDIVLSHFSSTLIDFLRFAIGDEFFNPAPESPIVKFFCRIPELNKHLETARSALSPTTTEDRDIKDVAKSLGRPSVLGDDTDDTAEQYLEDLVEQLSILMEFVEAEFKPTAEQLKLQLSYGHIAFDLLIYYFEKGTKYYTNREFECTGFKLLSASYSCDPPSPGMHPAQGGWLPGDGWGTNEPLPDNSNSWGNANNSGWGAAQHAPPLSSLILKGEILEWNGYRYATKEQSYTINPYSGTQDLLDLPCVLMSPETRADLIARGKRYVALAGVHYKSYYGERIVIDKCAYGSQNGYARWRDEPIPALEEEHYDLLPPMVYGFNMKTKTWSTFEVDIISDIIFDDKAWDHLVLEADTKNLIKGLVDVTKHSNGSDQIVTDVISGKGGGLIAVLHGPPGTGKTLTAEAVAEHLKRPLYTISSLELSTNPGNLEEKLSGILSLATAWDAVVLIDEADVFLEKRSLHELERNALVSVALRVLEYHRGVLFLTTNRIQAFDEAFLSRFSIAIKYTELNASARLTIWRKFFELAGCTLWGGKGAPDDDFVRLDGKEPKCYVSLADLEELSLKPFNGRTIKNLVRTAQALALSLNEPVSLDHVKTVVGAQERFLTEFAQISIEG